MTTRQAANRVRSIFKDRPGVTVRGETVSFSGFGHGSAFFVTINTPVALTDADKAVVSALGHCADDGTKIIYQLAGPAYMFGGTIC